MNFLTGILATFLGLLPKSPFTEFIAELRGAEWLSALNWVCPVGTFVKIAGAWGTAILVFYAYQIILRWVKAVDS